MRCGFDLLFALRLVVAWKRVKNLGASLLVSP